MAHAVTNVLTNAALLIACVAILATIGPNLPNIIRALQG